MLNRLKKHTEFARCAYCPLRYPHDEELKPNQQMSPEFRKGGVNASDFLLTEIMKIEQELFGHLDDLAQPTQCKLQLAPEDRCCKSFHHQVNQEDL
ncbi:hypothetical protein DX541_15965 [Vibrio fluvialis]|nr:hypothetical protein [Vibrio fluvialis]